MDANLYLQEKKEGMKTKPLKNLVIKPNNQSADFIAPPFAVGCEIACAYCIEKGTLISTSSGQVPVEQIQDGAVVLAYDSLMGQLVEARVQGTAYREVEELIELEVEDGTIRVSLEHPFLVIRDGYEQWVEAQHLAVDDEVLCAD
jgi:cation transport ATPase